jgi:hypothetical protein
MSRVLDRGAIFAGWVGAGMAAVIVLSFELVIPVQPVVFYSAPLAGLLIGYYANARSGRAGGPWARVVANAAYAGIVTGLSLAILYGAIRLLFFYGDAGFSANGQGGAVTCRSGADCTYQRYLADPASAAELRAAGITDAAGFERYFLGQQLDGGLILLMWTAVPALFGGLGFRAANSGARSSDSGVTPVPEPHQ